MDIVDLYGCAARMFTVSRANWQPVRPVLVPFSVFQHLYLTPVGMDSCPSSKQLYSPGYPSSAFRGVSVLSGDESVDSQQDSGMEDSFVLSSPRPGHRTPEDLDVAHIMASFPYSPCRWDSNCIAAATEYGQYDFAQLALDGHSGSPWGPASRAIPSAPKDEPSSATLAPTDREAKDCGEGPGKSSRSQRENCMNEAPKLRRLLAKTPSKSPELIVATPADRGFPDKGLLSPSVSVRAMLLAAMASPDRDLGGKPQGWPSPGTDEESENVAANRKRMKRASLSDDGDDQALPEESNRKQDEVGVKWQAHVCGICGRSFQYPRSLTTHQLVHQNIRPHKCTFSGCNKSFRQTGHLQTHLLIHTGEKPFRCPVEGCPTPAFRHANRRCPIHFNIRLKKSNTTAAEKPLDLSRSIPTNRSTPLSSNLQSGIGCFNQHDAQAALALLQFAGIDVPAIPASGQ